MSLHSESVAYGGGKYIGYFARPSRAEGPLPSILVLQEAWGVDAHIEDVTNRFALAGYAAMAPDVYAENGTRPPPMARDRLTELQGFVNDNGTEVFADAKAREAALKKLPADKAARVEESFGALVAGFGKIADHVPALTSATKYLRDERPETKSQKVGAVGYCMGGTLVGLLAANDEKLAVGCIYYGQSPSPDLVERILCPLFGFYGGEDARVNASIPNFAVAMKKADKSFESRIYEGAHHAFFNDNRPTYHAAASRDAFARTITAFRDNLV